MTGEEFRRALLDLVSAFPLADDEPENDHELPSAGVPVSALVMVEWQADDGHRWLSRMGALGSGDEAPEWTMRMLAHEAIKWSK